MAENHYLISDASKKVDVESHVLRYWEDELELKIPRNEMGHRYYTDAHIRLFCQIRDLKEKGYQLKAIKSALDEMAEQGDELTIQDGWLEDHVTSALKESAARMDGAPWIERSLQEGGISQMDGASLADKPAQAGAASQGERYAQAGAASQGERYAQAGAAPQGDGYAQAAAATEGNGGEEDETSLAKIQDGNTVIIAEEKMEQFQQIMNHIIGRALEVNNEKLSQDVSALVNDRVTKELEYLMRVTDEKEEERFKQLDETLRAYQKDNKGRAEAAASKIPFFRKKRFGRSGKKI